MAKIETRHNDGKRKKEVNKTLTVSRRHQPLAAAPETVTEIYGTRSATRPREGPARLAKRLNVRVIRST